MAIYKHTSVPKSSVTNRGCTSGGVYVPCIYTHARWELRRWPRSLLLYVCDVFRALINSLVWSILNAYGLRKAVLFWSMLHAYGLRRTILFWSPLHTYDPRRPTPEGRYYFEVRFIHMNQEGQHQKGTLFWSPLHTYEPRKATHRRAILFWSPLHTYEPRRPTPEGHYYFEVCFMHIDQDGQY